MASKNNAADLGSVGIGFKVDLPSLKKDLGQAEALVDNLGKKVNQNASKGAQGGGFLQNIITGGKAASNSLSGLAGGGGIISKLTSGLGGLGEGFSGMGSAAAAGGGAIVAFGAIALAAVAVIGVVVAAVKVAQFAFTQLKSAIDLAVGQQAIETSFKVLAQNMGISSAAADDFRAKLQGYNLAGAQATKIMQGLLNAQLPLNDSTLSLVDVAQRYAVIAGTDTPTAVSTMTDAISTLNPELLRQFGIVQTLPQIYDTYSQKLGVSADSLNTVQQRQAILNTIISQGTRIQGAQNAAQFDAGRGMQILRSNIDNFKAALGKVALPTFTGLLQILVPISRQLGGDTSNLSAKMEALGNKIAAVVVPAVSRFIGFIKSIPWVSIVDGAFRAFQILRILGEVWLLNARFAIAAGTAIVGVVAAVIAQVGRIAVIFKNVAGIAGTAWKVITGQASLSDLGKAIKTFGSSVVDGVTGPIVDLSKVIGKNFISNVNNVGDAFNGISDAVGDFGRGFNIKDFFESLPGASAQAWDAAAQDAGDGMDSMSAKARKALQKLAEDLAKENEDFARAQSKAASDFQDSLAELVAQHRDQINSIRSDLAKETKDFQKAQEKRANDYQDQLNNLKSADNDRKNDVQNQLAEEIAKGRFADQTKIASLQARLKYEDAANQKAVDAAQKQYDEDTTNANDEHQQKIDDLTTNLNKELAIQQKYADDFSRFQDFQIADDITKLKKSYADQQAEDARAHAEKIADLIKNGAEEAQQYGANGANNANNYVGALASGLGAGVPGLNSQALGMGQGIMDSTKNGTEGKRQSWWDKIKDVVGSGINKIGDFAGTAYNWGVNVLQNVINGVGNMATALKNSFIDVFNKAAGLVGSLTDFGKQLLGKAGSGIKSALGAVGGAFQSAWNAVGLPHFARGGIVQGPAGSDNVTAQLTAGEVVLNNAQQGRLFQLLNGQVSPNSSSGNGAGGVIIENMEVSLPNVKNGNDFTRELQLHFATRRIA